MQRFVITKLSCVYISFVCSIRVYSFTQISMSVLLVIIILVSRGVSTQRAPTPVNAVEAMS